MPPGMRETLYFKDDDTRLSFLQGNYVTLTNLKEKDIERIIRFKLAPINISVQTTNPELRCKMLHNRFAGQSLKLIDRLYEAGTPMNGQIVLCKGVNDGGLKNRSIEDLTSIPPSLYAERICGAGGAFQVQRRSVPLRTVYKGGRLPGHRPDRDVAEKAV